MRTSARLGLAAAALAAAAATPALAQSSYGSQGYGQQGYDRQAYPPSTYDRGSSSGYQPSSAYDRQGYAPPSSSGYDRQGYPPDRAGRYGQPDPYDQGQGPGQGQADDPEQLARQLNLSSSQRPAFDAYKRAFAPDQAREQQEEAEMQRMASMTTPQRLDAARAGMARDRADFDRTDAATRAFYNQLSAAQRRTFDRLTAPQMDDDGGPDGPSPTQPASRGPR